MKLMTKIQILKKGFGSKVLIIYTGGTLGMVADKKSGNLIPFDFKQIIENLPEIERLLPEIHLYSFEQLIDSSDITPKQWQELCNIIELEYENFDGFVVIHGTDTMAYSAAALSFMIQNSKKPIVFTGAQLPIGIPRTDARENLISAIEIASSLESGKAIVPEVCIYFNGRLLRGNRAKKRESSQFDAFDSENYPYLAEIGVSIDYNTLHIKPYEPRKPTLFSKIMEENVFVLNLFPGIKKEFVSYFFDMPGLSGVVLESYGSGNTPSGPWFLDLIKNAISNNITILNISQCTGGHIRMGKYASSQKMLDLGVINGQDMNTEAAITKLMWVLGKTDDQKLIKEMLETSIAGELIA
jgi:L-asparaginase